MDLTDILSSHHYEVYCQETKTYTSKKNSGLYSILNWVVRKIALLELNNFPVEFLKIDYLIHTFSFRSAAKKKKSLADLNG